MRPRLRKFALTAHVVASVGWLGAVIAYLPLAVTGLTSHDPQTVRAAYLAMELIGWFTLVPLSFTALLTGMIQSLGTEWGLFRYYWVLAKFLLTVGATTILLLHMPAVSQMAGIATEMPLVGPDFRESRVQLVVHAVGGLLVLLTVTTLSVFKPWGRTPYGRRKQEERRTASQARPATATDSDSHPPGAVESNARTEGGSDPGSAHTRWRLYVLLAVVLVVLFVVLHLTAGGLRHH